MVSPQIAVGSVLRVVVANDEQITLTVTKINDYPGEKDVQTVYHVECDNEYSSYLIEEPEGEFRLNYGAGTRGVETTRYDDVEITVLES